MDNIVCVTIEAHKMILLAHKSQSFLLFLSCSPSQDVVFFFEGQHDVSLFS